MQPSEPSALLDSSAEDFDVSNLDAAKIPNVNLENSALEAGASKAPLALLRRQAKAAFPNLTAEEEIEWLGHRPAPSDSLPLIGQIGTSRVYTAFGHHHIGLTGGPKTGRLVAGLITGQPPNTDLTPYHPQRFDR